MFNRASDCWQSEIDARIDARTNVLSFGVKFLDEACEGILENDLILIGAHSGGGKTQLCVNIAKANVELGKKVHYIALEAEPLEIERRIKYQLFCKYLYLSTDRNITPRYSKWRLGDYSITHARHEASAAEEFKAKYENLFTYYKTSKFDIQDLMLTVTACAKETDLIIIDHVHYFDYDSDNENKAVKEIAKAARTLALENSKPIILVSHIRKRDFRTAELAPGLEEFHGSSDLYKIATKSVTIGPGGLTLGSTIQTYFRVVKERFDGSVTRFLAMVEYDFKKGSYNAEYKLGKGNQKASEEFTEIDFDSYPDWAKSANRSSSLNSLFPNAKRKF